MTGADLDTLQSLVDKSLVRRTEGRFWMLETIREFAIERLEASGEADSLGRAHAEHFLALGESANLSAESDRPERPELVRPELDNFRRAIDWAAETDLELAFRLAISMEQFWVMNDAFEGARRMAELLERGSAVPEVLRARALRVNSEAIFVSGDFTAAAELLEQSLSIFQSLGDEPAFTWMQASALMDAADLSHELGRTVVAGARGREALRLAEELADRRSIVYSLAWLARFAAADGRIDEAGRLWGAIEAEELRGPIGAWAQEREQFAVASALVRRA